MHSLSTCVKVAFTSSGVAQLITVTMLQKKVSSTRLYINIPHCVCLNLKTRMSGLNFRTREVLQGMVEIILCMLAMAVMKCYCFI